MNAPHPALIQPLAASTLRKRIARAFGRSASSYDQHAALQRQVADSLLAKLPLQQQVEHVLDIGCGTGYSSSGLRRRYPAAAVVALDLALPMLKVAHEQLNGAAASIVQLLCGDAQSLPLKNDSVELLFSSLALQWCSNPAMVFAEIKRVLKPGGVALLGTLGPATLQELREAWAEVDQSRHSNEFVPEWQLQQATESAGLQMELEREVIVRHYGSLLALAHELKGLGANVVTATQVDGMTTPSAFKAAAAVFARRQQAAGIPVSWEIFYLRLRKGMETRPL
jgi:malonyl-CoA O-methyltransferase